MRRRERDDVWVVFDHLESHLMASRYLAGCLKQADGEYRNTTRRFVPDAADTITSAKFAKRISGPGAPYDAPLGHELEIVPLSDPAVARPGVTLQVKVLFRGQPVAGAKGARIDGETFIAQDKLPVSTADGAGVASIPIKKAGGEVFSVGRRVSPSSTPGLADADTLSATLAFSLNLPRTN